VTAMASPISDPPDWLDRGQPNALNLFRLALAMAVIVSHGLTMMNPSDSGIAHRVSLGALAVNGFFAISGFLITSSWSSSPERYLRARIARIVPGFVVALFASAIIAAVAAGSQWAVYFRSINVEDFVAGVATLNSTSLNQQLAFPLGPWPHVVNGPMWTIPIEFGCYLGVAIFGTIGGFKKRPLVLFLFLVSATFYLRNIQPVSPGWGELSWPRFSTFFAAGAVLNVYRKSIPKHWILALACAGGLAASFETRWYFATMPSLGVYLLFYVAYSLPKWAQKIGATNDISYGVYLYAFPFQQLYYQFDAKGVFPHSTTAHLLICSAWAIGCGWASWKLVEKPCMVALRNSTSSRQ
jgi:peptidoglycan/LPS O-acetylase OafA/YrhL